RARDHLALDGPLHLGHFLRPLVDEQHDEIDLGMVGGNGGGNVLQQHRLAGLRRRDDETALALADRRHEIDGAGGQVLGGSVAALQLQALGGMEWRQVLEEDLGARAVGGVEVDLADLEQREVALAILRRADEAGDGVAGAQVEAADLAGADVDVVGPCQVGAVGRAQEAEAVLQDLQHAVAVDVLPIARMRLEDGEDDVLLARAGEAVEPHGLGDLDQLVDGLRLELREVHRGPRAHELRGADDLRVVDVEGLRLVHRLVGAAAAVAIRPVAVAIAVAVTIAAAVARTLGPVAALIAEVASHRLLSRNADSCDLDKAPTFWAWTVPFLKRMSVGMPRMPNFGGVCGFSSMLSLAILRRSSYSPAISSRIGAIILQGPHHSAQKSRSTGLSDLRTSWAKVESLVCTMCGLLTRLNLRRMQSAKGCLLRLAKDLDYERGGGPGKSVPETPVKRLH